MKPSTSSVLSLEGVTKLFGTKAAVNELSLEVQKGEIFGFLGPNGAGKTTTIRVILDILRPNKGSVRLFGQNNRLTKITHRQVGYLSGEMVLDPDLSGRQYLNFVNHVYGGGNQKRASELAQLLQVDLSTKIESYSSGNRQKVALISALAHQPDLLILDEPTNGFDPLVQEIFMDLIKKYQAEGGTVFMSSHVLSEVQKLCSRVAFIKEGSLIGVKDIDIEELKETSTKTIKIIGKGAEISALKAKYKNLPGLKFLGSGHTSINLSYGGDISKLLKFLASFEIADITITEPELEEVFMNYYKQGGKER